jgi:hypothetical protein
MNAAWPAAFILGGGAVRFIKGTPTCAKSSSCPAGAHDGLFAAEGGFDLAFKDGERLLKIMSVGWRTAAGRDVHVDQAIATVGVVAREQNRIGISDEPDMGQVLVGVRSRDHEVPLGVVGRHRRDGF